MPTLDIGDDECADLFEVSQIDMRIAHGSLLTTIGRHPEIGDFVVVQTMAELGRDFVLVSGTDEWIMADVIDEWGVKSAKDMARITAEYAAKLDQAATNRQG